MKWTELCRRSLEAWADRKMAKQGAHSPARGSAQAALIPSTHLSATVDRGHCARDKAAKEEIHAAGSKTPGLWEGRGGAGRPAGLH